MAERWGPVGLSIGQCAALRRRVRAQTVSGWKPEKTMPGMGCTDGMPARCDSSQPPRFYETRLNSAGARKT